MKGRSILLLTTIAASIAALPVVYAQNTMAEQVAYKVVNGTQVDKNTYEGWRTWRALACERCHGAQQQGMVGPSLIDALQKIDKNEFHRTIFGGRIDKGMPDFSASDRMQKNWENLYTYLKGRSDGKIKPGDLQLIEGKN